MAPARSSFPLRQTAWSAAALLCLLLIAPLALARHRVVRQVPVGLLPTRIVSVAQDPQGFLWIGSAVGLFRYDGSEAKRWVPELISTEVSWLRTSTDGRVHALLRDGAAYEILEDGVRSLRGPDERTSDLARAHGTYWTIHEGRLAAEDGGWGVLPLPLLDGDEARVLREGLDGQLYVATRNRLFQVDARRTVRELTQFTGRVVDVLAQKDGAVWIALFRGEVWRWQGGKLERRLALDARTIALALRGETLWASFDKFVALLPPTGEAELTGPAEGLTSGGPLLVDHEGSVWVGTFDGLFQYPEPDTFIVDQADGLATSHARFVTPIGERLWVTTWQGVAAVDPLSAAVTPHPECLSRGPVCAEANGTVWTVSERALCRLESDGRFREVPVELPSHVFANCAPTLDGGLWMSVGGRLVKVRQGRVESVQSPPVFTDGIPWLHADRAGRLWSGNYREICHASASEADLETAPWRCHKLEGAQEVPSAFVEPSEGELWVTLNHGGVLRWTGDGWAATDFARQLGSSVVLGARPSPRGGVWLLGEELLVRVRVGAGGALEVLERPGAWQGLPSSSGGDIHEAPDGTLWISASQGVIRVPAHVRDAPLPTPRVKVTEIRVDGSPVAPLRSFQLPYERNRVELRFAALSFREPRLLRYRVRLEPEQDWTPTGHAPSFHFVDLSPRSYTALVGASLDGERWSSAPAGVRFDVERPWFLKPWALVAFAVGLVAAGWLAHRARVLVKVRLERQRAGIAMDLHDEMGAGLGSIGVLAAVAANDQVPERARREALEKILSAASELGGALSDIVWSLKSRQRTLGSLMVHLQEKANRLFPSGVPSLQFHMDDEAQALSLPLPVFRNLQLIGTEALHNVSRHAQATVVTLGLMRRGRGWCITIADDGCGMGRASPASRRTGMGLENMRRRAEDLGARLEWRAPPRGGTELSVVFEAGRPSSRREQAS